MNNTTQYSYKASPCWRWRNRYYLNSNYLFQKHLIKREKNDTFNTIKTTP